MHCDPSPRPFTAHRPGDRGGIPCCLLALGVLLMGSPSYPRAAPPVKPPSEVQPARGYLDPLFYRDAMLGSLASLREREIVQMLSAVASGSQMGPGDGWFHPGQGRYDWKWLAARHDINGDGRITLKEFKGPRELFDRLDRDRDGVITRDDLDWSERSPYVRMSGMIGGWFNRIDTSSNGRISRDEWEEFFKRAGRGKEHLTTEDLRDALLQAPPKPKDAPKESGPSPAVLFTGLLHGELGSFFEGPAVGDRAPNFTLQTHDSKRTIALKDYRGKKPVVLIFGSFT
jgi:hypothetical protein